MPFLKFLRDKRGYEYFSLVEPTSGRHGKSHARVLFWFRTPPQVRVGREPFTEEVRRAIETQNPGVRFDWARLMATPIPIADAEHWRERRRAEHAARQVRRASDEAETSARGEPAEMVPAGDIDTDVPAEAVAPASDLEEQASTSPSPAISAPVSAPDALAGGRRRRRRRGRRKPPLQPETAAGPVAPNVPGAPSDEV